MKDRVSLYPGRVKLTPVSGQENTYDMVRADSPTQEGTPLNKASLLQDETAALYGQGADAVPDDILSILSKAVLTINGNLQDIGGKKVGPRIATGSYAGTGTYGPSNQCSLMFDFVPKFVIVKSGTFGLYPGYYAWEPMAFIWYTGTTTVQTGNGSDYYCSITQNGNNISWYNNFLAKSQLNESGTIYYYIAIG